MVLGHITSVQRLNCHEIIEVCIQELQDWFGEEFSARINVAGYDYEADCESEYPWCAPWVKEPSQWADPLDYTYGWLDVYIEKVRPEIEEYIKLESDIENYPEHKD